MNITKKILVLATNPKNTARLRLDEEVREIDDVLHRSKYREHFTMQVKWAVRPIDLQRAMSDYEPQIVHFAGHGEENGLMVEDENGNAVLVTPDALSGLFELFKDSVECVLLNTCYSELHVDAIKKHIKYVIGMRQGITDKSALRFAVGFYNALGAGRAIEEAYRFGCNAIQLSNLSENLIPILKKRLRDSTSTAFIGSDTQRADVRRIGDTTYSLVPSSDTARLTEWRIGKQLINLEPLHRHLCIISNSGKLGWVRLAGSRTTFIARKIATEMQCKVSLFPWRSRSFKYVLSLTAVWNKEELDLHQKNLLIIIEIPDSPASLEIEARFSLDEGDFLKFVDCWKIGRGTPSSDLLRIEKWIQNDQKQIKEQILDLLLSYQFEEVKLRGEQADRFFGPIGTAYKIYIKIIQGHYILVAEEERNIVSSSGM